MTNTTTPKMTIEITDEQVDRLEQAFAWSKAFSSPLRLAILGALAAQAAESVSIEALSAAARDLRPPQLDREIQILADAGLVRIVEWAAPTPGVEPRPAQVTFNSDYLQAAPQVTATLHKLVKQARPAAATPVADERTQVLSRLMAHGRLLYWPAQFKRQVWVMEEVARAFEPRRTYTEREVDAILKEIFAHDHCTLRRFLIDLKFMQRENGVYWKTESQPTGA